MSSSMVPMKANFHTMFTSEFQFIKNCFQGNRPTDSHKLYDNSRVWHIWYNIFWYFLYILSYFVYLTKNNKQY